MVDNDKYKDYGVYVVTMDYLATGEGHSRAILIMTAMNAYDAKMEFAVRFGSYFAAGAEVTKGLIIPEGYADLLTDYARKIIARINSKSPDAPGGFSYSNYIHVNYS